MTGCILNRFIVQVLFRQLSLFSRLVLTNHIGMQTNDTNLTLVIVYMRRSLLTSAMRYLRSPLDPMRYVVSNPQSAQRLTVFV